MNDLVGVVLDAPFWIKTAWLIGTNIFAFVLMLWDKTCAVKGLWRVSEPTLLLWSAVGGAFGAKFAQRKFRHKTKKEPFRSQLNFAGACSLLLAVVVFVVPSETIASLTD